MADETKTTQTLLRALLKEMEKSLTEHKPYEPDMANYKTRVDTAEFLRGQGEENWWDEGGGDEEAFIGLRPKPKPKPRGKRRLR